MGRSVAGLSVSARKPLLERKTQMGRRQLSPRLLAALLVEWEFNHSEHCSDEWPHPEGRRCHWPQPEVLSGLPLESWDPRFVS
jgi:hypothetical protein